ncbi:hypothetical protein NDU88_004887 [Pleurodeles waltl]|uniref:Uncharacterized protein n=1 Tax=Pleurodeles waltl TaxID=8319 RepID=A0AAV7NMC9_PLEWA|nr:hypothetical protein NDU88_004887 [Pleurodeles waltl]
MGAAVTDIRRKNAEAERVFKPEQNEQEEKEFSPGREDGAMTESRMSRPEQKPGRRRRQGETLSNPGGSWRKVTGRREGANRPATGKSVAQAGTERKYR